jgi:hypothetical protein
VHRPADRQTAACTHTPHVPRGVVLAVEGAASVEERLRLAPGRVDGFQHPATNEVHAACCCCARGHPHGHLLPRGQPPPSAPHPLTARELLRTIRTAAQLHTHTSPCDRQRRTQSLRVRKHKPMLTLTRKKSTCMSIQLTWASELSSGETRLYHHVLVQGRLFTSGRLPKRTGVYYLLVGLCAMPYCPGYDPQRRLYPLSSAVAG